MNPLTRKNPGTNGVERDWRVSQRLLATSEPAGNFRVVEVAVGEAPGGQIETVGRLTFDHAPPCRDGEQGGILAI